MKYQGIQNTIHSGCSYLGKNAYNIYIYIHVYIYIVVYVFTFLSFVHENPKISRNHVVIPRSVDDRTKCCAGVLQRCDPFKYDPSWVVLRCMCGLIRQSYRIQPLGRFTWTKRCGCSDQQILLGPGLVYVQVRKEAPGVQNPPKSHW